MSKYKISVIIFPIALVLSVALGSLMGGIIIGIVFITVLSVGSFSIERNFYLNSVNKANTEQKKIVLSFDDGPTETTPKVLDVLKEYNCQAIFFCIGNRIKGNEDIVKRMVAEGHIIANHTFSHSPWFDFFSSDKVHDEIKRTNEEIYRVTGLRSKLFRPPYGVTNPMIAKVLSASGHLSIGWNKRSLDTVTKSNDKIVARILNNTRPGDIILLHDSLGKCPELLRTFLPELYKNDFKVERIDKLTQIQCYEN